MGYKRKMKIYELHFEGEEFEGLVVKAKSMSVDGFLGVLSLSQTAEDPMTQRELFTAQTILSLCDRFKCLPSQLEKEDASVLRLIAIEYMGKKAQPPEQGLKEY